MAAASRAEVPRELAVAEEGYRSAAGIAVNLRFDELVYEAMSVSALGDLYFNEGKFAQAENSFLKALSGFERSGDRAMALRVAANLSTLYLETGQIAGAEQMIGRYRNSPGRALDDLDGAVLLSNLAEVRLRQAMSSVSESLYRTVIDGLQEPRRYRQANRTGRCYGKPCRFAYQNPQKRRGGGS